MLTKQERKWLEKREKNLHCFGLNLAFTPGMSPAFSDFRDAAEFEARVVVELTEQDRCPLPENAGLDDCPYFNDDKDSTFSCSWCQVKRARLTVEQEMEEEACRKN